MKRLILILLLLVPFAGAYDINDRLIDYWNFDSALNPDINTTVGINGMELNLTIDHFDRVEGWINNTIVPRSINSVMNIDATKAGFFDSVDAITFSLWMNYTPSDFTTDSDIESYILTKGTPSASGVFMFIMSGLGGPFVEFRAKNETNSFDAVSYGGQDINNTEFHNFVFGKNLTDIFLYYNGSLVNITSFSGKMGLNAGVDFEIYQDSDRPGDGEFSGSIDQLGIWNRSLTSEEISRIHDDQFKKIDFITGQGFVENTHTYNATVSENSLQNFNINFSYDNNYWQSASATLVYNNTRNEGTISGNEEYLIADADINVGAVTTETLHTFRWEIALQNSTDTVWFNSSNQQQTVENNIVNVGASCGSGFFPGIEFLFQDETNLTNITTDVEYTFRYGVDNFDSMESGSFTNIQSFVFCVNETQDDLRLGLSEIFFGKDDYVEERFYIPQNTPVSNTTTTNHTLLNLLSISATSFLFDVKENDLLPLANHLVYLQRWYPELGEYKTAEITRTDDNGEGVMKLVAEDVDYRYQVLNINGTTVHLTEPSRAICLVDPCEIQIFVGEASGFDIFLGIETNLSYNNETGIFTLVYNDPAQATTLMNLTAFLHTSSGQVVLCSSTSTSFSGVLTCDTAGVTGTITAQVRREASPAIVIQELIINTGALISDLVGGNVVLIGTFFLAGFLAFVGAFINPMIGLIFAVIALVPAVVIGGIEYIALTGIIGLIIITIHFIRRNAQNV